MLKFKEFELSDIVVLKKYIFSPTRFSCETNFVNLIVWQKAYKNMYALYDDILFIKSGTGNDETYRLPFGENLEKGFKILREHTNTEFPKMWVQQGERFLEFNSKFGEFYELIPERDAFDYIYLQQDLANLSGKKYHSKRNHISAFKKQNDYIYREITSENIPDILECANEWYAKNEDKFDKYMQSERDGINFILQNMDTLFVKGGAIYVEGKVVAFTLGSPINRYIFDIHIEKALPEYATAYTVINNEFAKTLGEYKYINREDDLGLEGLRKAKLSYKPNILLKKYLCLPKAERYEQIYNAAFAEEDNTFQKALFSKCSKFIETLGKDGRIVSMCFALPCKISGRDAKYIFALTTPQEFRGNGYAKKLLERLKTENEILILRPATKELIEYYKKQGFSEFTATNIPSDFALEPQDEFYDLAKDYKEKDGIFTALYYSSKNINLDNIYFPYSMI